MIKDDFANKKADAEFLDEFFTSVFTQLEGFENTDRSQYLDKATFNEKTLIGLVLVEMAKKTIVEHELKELKTKYLS